MQKSLRRILRAGPCRLLLVAWIACGLHWPVFADASDWTDPCVGAPDRSAAPDHAILGEVLAAHVSSGTKRGIKSTLVDYKTLRKNPAKLHSYLAQLCKVDLDSLSKAEALATLLNAYNAVMLAVIVAYNPPASVKELNDFIPGGVWKGKVATAFKQSVSLDNIEHDLIRGKYGAIFAGGKQEARIHAAVNCASLSCPDLLRAPFLAATLDAQLTNATTGWLANPTKNAGPDADGTIRLSKIFEWYAGDFVAAEGSVQAFVRKYSEWNVPDGAQLQHMPYYWDLNSVSDAPEFTSSSQRFCRFGILAVVFAALGAVLALAVTDVNF